MGLIYLGSLLLTQIPMNLCSNYGFSGMYKFKTHKIQKRNNSLMFVEGCKQSFVVRKVFKLLLL